jgi:FAD/FMN-containing dehydrogenase
MTDLLDRIAAIVGSQGLLTGEDVSSRSADAMGVSMVEAHAIVRPATTTELSEVMKLCHAAGQKVVPAGGYTGLVHGSTCTPDEIQISLERMRTIEAIDPIGRTMTVQAGCAVQSVQEAASEAGLKFAVDWGARGTATIGGGISTNAGGNAVIRYGMMRDSVLGIEAVLADGTIISAMNVLLKNNAAYDVKQLFIGTEGTLGIVTRAVLKLQPAPLSTSTALLALDSFDAVQALFVHAGKRLGAMLTSFEVMWHSFYDEIAIQSGNHVPPLPGGHGYYVIVEASGTDQERDAELFETVLGEALEQGAVDAVIASSKAQAEQIWAIRDDVRTLALRLMPMMSLDVSLPIIAMDGYVQKLEADMRSELGDGVKLVVFGHIGDGNLHIVLRTEPYTPETKYQIEQIVYNGLVPHGGSISAEHGIGLDKRGWLHITRSPAEIALMRTIKAAMDPTNILNPGKVLG